MTFYLVNDRAFQSEIAVFNCPSDGQQPPLWRDYAVTNYQANFGTDWNRCNESDGPFHIISKTGIAAITDGTSNTAAFSEHGHGGITVSRINREFRLRGGFARPKGSSANQSELEKWCEDQVEAVDLTYAHGGGGVKWSLDAVGYRHVLRPNHPVCSEYKDPTQWIFGPNVGSYSRIVNPPTSLHPGGVNLLFCDGHVRFVSETIDDRPKGPWRRPRDNRGR